MGRYDHEQFGEQVYSLAVEEQIAPWAWYECCPWYGATYIVHAEMVNRIKIGCVRGLPKEDPINVLDLAPEAVAGLRRSNMLRALFRRIPTLYYSSPVPLKMLALFHGGVDYVEKYLQRQFGEFRVHGEWFEAEPVLEVLQPLIESAHQNKTCVTRQLPALVTRLEELKVEEDEFKMMATAYAKSTKVIK